MTRHELTSHRWGHGSWSQKGDHRTASNWHILAIHGPCHAVLLGPQGPGHHLDQSQKLKMCVLSSISIQFYEMMLRQRGTLPLTTAMEQKFFKKLPLIWAKKKSFHGAKFLFIFYVCHFVVLSALWMLFILRKTQLFINKLCANLL